MMEFDIVDLTAEEPLATSNEEYRVTYVWCEDAKQEHQTSHAPFRDMDHIHRWVQRCCATSIDIKVIKVEKCVTTRTAWEEVPYE